MRLEEIWAAHKRFLLAVGAALLVVFVASRIVHSMFVSPASRLERSTESLLEKLRRRAAPTQDDIREQKNRGRELDARLAEAEARVGFTVDPDFLLPRGGDFDLAYNDRFREVRDSVMGRAGVEGITIDPSLGMPESTPADRAEAQRVLKALDLIREVLHRALDQGVDSIPQIRIPTGGRKGFLAAKSYLREIRASFEVTGSADAVVGLVGALTVAERFVTVDALRGEQLDPKRPGRVRVRMDVVGYEIDPEAPSEAPGTDPQDRETRKR